jgi:hypothetical protein
MLKMHVAFIAFAAAFFASAHAFALPVAPGEYFDAKVDNVKAYASGKFNVNFDRLMCNINAAAGDDDDYAIVASTATGRDQIMSVAISALLSGKTVRVFATDPASGECTIDALMILK